MSLYDIFVREKLEVPGKPALSYWTLRSDVNRPRASATYSQADLNDSLCVKGRYSVSRLSELFIIAKRKYSSTILLLISVFPFVYVQPTSRWFGGRLIVSGQH